MYYTKLGKNTVNAVRFAEVLQVMVRHGFADLLGRAGFRNGLPARVLRSLNLIEAPKGPPETLGARLCAALTELGPTFVKFGQILSTRSDIVGPTLAQELTHLQDNVEPVPFDKMRGVFVETLGEEIETLYATFNTTPVASASLSQVYQATLSGGEKVAVKVQRPGSEKKIEADLSLMRQIADWIAEHMEDAKLLDPAGIVDEFARSIHRELDFNIEARIIDQFAHNFEDMPQVFIPGVYHDFSSSRIITMDWIDGVRVDQLDAYEARNCDPHTMALLGCDVLCRMIFEQRLFHADPHPGNLFITQNNQIAFLDLGMAGHLERTDVAAIADLFLAIFHEDTSACINAILTLTTQGEPHDMHALEHEIAEFIAFEAPTIIGGGQVGRGIETALQILRRYKLELAPRFSLLLKALATIETVGRALDPKFDFVPIIQPYLEHLILMRFHPKQVLKEARLNASALLKLGRQIPDDVGRLLQQMRHGKVRFNIHHEYLENLAHTIDRSSNRQVVGMITAAIIVGSSLIIATDSPLSRLGIGGYIFAGLLGAGLIISILWSRKF